MNILQSLRLFDHWLLVRATQFTHSSPVAELAVYIAAEVLIFVFPFVLYILWRLPETRGKHHVARKTVIIALMGVIAVLAIKSGISYIVNRPRPFVTYTDLLYLPLRVDPPSFPSAHTMIAVTIAGSLLLSGFKRLGWTLLGISMLIALGRVFAGVHYPSDVFGGIVVGSLVVFYLHREASTLRKYLPNE